MQILNFNHLIYLKIPINQLNINIHQVIYYFIHNLHYKMEKLLQINYNMLNY